MHTREVSFLIYSVEIPHKLTKMTVTTLLVSNTKTNYCRLLVVVRLGWESMLPPQHHAFGTQLEPTYCIYTCCSNSFITCMLFAGSKDNYEVFQELHFKNLQGLTQIHIIVKKRIVFYSFSFLSSLFQTFCCFSLFICFNISLCHC